MLRLCSWRWIDPEKWLLDFASTWRGRLAGFESSGQTHSERPSNPFLWSNRPGALLRVGVSLAFCGTSLVLVTAHFFDWPQVSPPLASPIRSLVLQSAIFVPSPALLLPSLQPKLTQRKSNQKGLRLSPAPPHPLASQVSTSHCVRLRGKCFPFAKKSFCNQNFRVRMCQGS